MLLFSLLFYFNLPKKFALELSFRAIHTPQNSAGKCILPISFLKSFHVLPTRNAGAVVGQGGRRLRKDTCTDYEVIITSEFRIKGSGGLRDSEARSRNHLGGLCLKILC